MRHRFVRSKALFVIACLTVVAAPASGQSVVAMHMGRPHARPVAIRRAPLRLSVRAAHFASRDRILQTTTPYAGTVITLPGTYPAAQAIAYDINQHAFYVATSSGFGNTTIYRAKKNGTSVPFTTVTFAVNGMTYDSATQLLYMTSLSGSSGTVTAMSPVDGTLTPLAGSTFGTSDGQGSAAQFQLPQGIAVDASGQNLYVADVDRIRQVTVGGVVTTLTAPNSIGPPGGSCYGNEGLEGIAFDPLDSQLYVTDPCLNIVHRVEPGTGQVTTAAGRCVSAGVVGCVQLQRDGIAAVALFAAPSGIAYDPGSERLLISDAGNNQIRYLTKFGKVGTLAGSGHAELVDGVGNQAGFSNPLGLAAASGFALVADSANNVLRNVISYGPAPPPPLHGIAMYDTPTPGGGPFGIAATADGSIWFSERNAGRIGRRKPLGAVVEYALPSGHAPGKMATGSDGNVWFTDSEPSAFPPAAFIGTINKAGTITEYPLLYNGGGLYPPSANNITLGPDGNIWFVDVKNNILGYILPSGSSVEYVSDPASGVSGGFSGDVWTIGQGFVDDTSTSGALLTKYSAAVSAGAIARGLNQTIWFTQPSAIGEVFPSTLVLFLLPTSPCCQSWNPDDIVMGRDQALWIAATAPGMIGQMTTDGYLTTYEVPAPRSAPESVTVAPDGTLWFADPGASKIGRWF